MFTVSVDVFISRQSTSYNYSLWKYLHIYHSGHQITWTLLFEHISITGMRFSSLTLTVSPLFCRLTYMTAKNDVLEQTSDSKNLKYSFFSNKPTIRLSPRRLIAPGLSLCSMYHFQISVERNDLTRGCAALIISNSFVLICLKIQFVQRNPCISYTKTL